MSDRSSSTAALQAPGRSSHIGERRETLRRSTFRPASRVYLPAPSHWKASHAQASLHAFDWTIVTGKARLPRAHGLASPPRAEAAQLLPPTRVWLLPPTWPLDGLRTGFIASARQRVDARWSPWIRTASKRTVQGRLFAGAAILAVATVMALLMRVESPAHRGEPATTIPVAAKPAAHKPVTREVLEPARPPPSRSPVASLPAIAPALAAAAPVTRVADQRKLWSDVSTMDLMMPIAEPDLDINSRTSLWSQIGKSAGVDPLLLYSIALVESKALYPDGKLAPTPWLFRVNNHLVRGDRRDVQLAMAAASQFGSAVQDVGIMQVYYPMHRDAVRDPLTLLNPRTNISVAAKILRAGMRQTPDHVLGVGYYHSHTPSLARDYGAAVMTVYQRLRVLHPHAARAHAVARE